MLTRNEVKTRIGETKSPIPKRRVQSLLLVHSSIKGMPPGNVIVDGAAGIAHPAHMDLSVDSFAAGDSSSLRPLRHGSNRTLLEVDAPSKSVHGGLRCWMAAIRLGMRD
ncbi:hypothetical protein G7046_g6252 [Stylonectria norvegica]|nr:hypothetical protein G7046_g6252 [Stylonectria norvegica]